MLDIIQQVEYNIAIFYLLNIEDEEELLLCLNMEYWDC